MEAGMNEKNILLCDKPQEIYSAITVLCKSRDAVLLEGRIPAGAELGIGVVALPLGEDMPDVAGQQVQQDQHDVRRGDGLGEHARFLFA